MAFTTPIELTIAATLSPPIDSHALPEHSRNNKDIRDKCVFSEYSIEYRSKFVTKNQQNETAESTGILIYEINH
jgi:hypothetical protein